MRVADLMSTGVAVCSPEESIRVAAQRMLERGCGCLPVTAWDGTQQRLVGIVTDRDLVCRAVAAGLDPEHTAVERCMSFPVHTIDAEVDIVACADRFTAVDVRRLVVTDGEHRCLGILSHTDLKRYVVPADGQPPPATAPVPTPTARPVPDPVSKPQPTARVPDRPELTL